MIVLLVLLDRKADLGEKIPDVDVLDQSAPKPAPPYAVILHNDDSNTMEFVVSVLRKVFKYSIAKSWWLMLSIHFKGKGIIWSGSEKEAREKAQQVIAMGPDPSLFAKFRRAGPLTVTVEQLPGDDNS